MDSSNLRNHGANALLTASDLLRTLFGEHELRKRAVAILLF